MTKPFLKKKRCGNIQHICWVGNERVHAFLKRNIQKVNVIVQLEFEFAYDDVADWNIFRKVPETFLRP